MNSQVSYVVEISTCRHVFVCQRIWVRMCVCECICQCMCFSVGVLNLGFNSDGFGRDHFKWRLYGFPFHVFHSRCILCPYLSLSLVDDLLLQKRGFLAGASHPAVCTHPVVRPDIIGEEEEAGALLTRVRSTPVQRPCLKRQTCVPVRMSGIRTARVCAFV